MAIYFDIGIGAILLISLIFGIVKGFFKQFNEEFCGLIAIIGSIALTIIIMPLIQKTSLFKSFVEISSGWFTKECYTTTVTSIDELNAALSSNELLQLLQSLSDRIFNRMQQCQTTTLGAYFGDMAARFIVGIILWVILLIFIKLFLKGIRVLLNKIAKAPVLHTFDKIIGGLWSICIAYLVVVSLLMTAIEIVILKWAPSNKEQLVIIINESYLIKFFHNTNEIGYLLAKLFGINLSDIAI